MLLCCMEMQISSIKYSELLLAANLWEIHILEPSTRREWIHYWCVPNITKSQHVSLNERKLACSCSATRTNSWQFIFRLIDNSLKDRILCKASFAQQSCKDNSAFRIAKATNQGMTKSSHCHKSKEWIKSTYCGQCRQMHKPSLQINGQQCYNLLKYVAKKYLLNTVQNHTEPHVNMTQELVGQNLHEVQETDHSTQSDLNLLLQIKLHGSLTL